MATPPPAEPSSVPTLPDATAFYVTGGTLGAHAASYIERQADHDLLGSLTAGDYCYVLNSRQMGKSSLCVRTMARLKERGGRTCFLDLTKFGGRNLSADQWYAALLSEAGRELGLRSEMLAFWRQNTDLGPMQRLFGAIQTVALPASKSPLTVFVDEIDVTRGLPFSADEFFAGIRQCYVGRATDGALNRLTFCLLGTATPADLIQDTRTSPFNIGRRIEVRDFTPEEAAPLAQGLGADGLALLSRVLSWTGGHPYLTQRLCRAVQESGAKTAGDVDKLCSGLFLTRTAAEADDNLAFVRNRLLKSEVDLAGLLDLYAQMRQGRAVPDDEADPLCAVLKLSGVARTEGGRLHVRNRIYEHVFSREWIVEHMPGAELRRQREAFRRGVVRTGTVAAAVVLVMGLLAAAAVHQARIAQAAELSEKQAHLASEHLRYASDMELAAQAWRAENASKTEALLDAHLPGHGDTQDQRDFAWRYQWNLLHRTVSLRPGGVPTAGGWTLGGSIVTLSAQGERRWSAAGKPLGQTLRWNERASESLLAPNGSTLAVYAPNGRLALLDPETLHTKHLLRLASAPRRAWSFSPNGRWLLVVDTHGVARVWDTPSGRLAHTTRGIGTEGRDVALASDGSTFAVADRPTARGVTVYDAAKPTEARARQYELERFTQTVTAVAFSPDGRRLAAGDWGGHIAAWNLNTHRALPGFEQATIHSRVNCLAFSPNGKTLAIGRRDGRAMLWDATRGVVRHSLVGHIQPVTFLVWRSDGAALATGSQDGSVRVWQSTRTMDSQVLSNAVDAWNHSVFSPDGRLLAVICLYHRVEIFDTRAWKSVQRLDFFDSPSRLAFTPDGKALAVGTADMNVYLWDIHAQRTARVFVGLHAVPAESEFAVSALAVSRDGRYLAAGAGYPTNYGEKFDKCWDHGAVCVWDLQTGRLLASLPGCRILVTALAFSPDSQMLAMGSQDNQVRLWRVGTWTYPVRTFTGPDQGEMPYVLALAFTPDGRQLAVGGFEGPIALHDVRTGAVRGRLIGHTDAVREVSFTPGGRLLASAGFDDTVKLWDVASARDVYTLTDHTDEVLSAVFSPSGDTLVTSGWDGPLRVWQAPPQSLFVTDSGAARPPESLPQTWVASVVPDPSSRDRDWQRHLRECVRHIPPRPAGATSAQIDLSHLYNAPLDAQWFLHDLEDLPPFSGLPHGLRTLAGTRWDIRGVIQLANDTAKILKMLGADFPNQVSIPVNRRCRRLDFLHASFSGATPATRDGAYVIHYADGGQVEAPLRYGVNIGLAVTNIRTPDPVSGSPTPGAKVAWVSQVSQPRVLPHGRRKRLRLYKFTWPNPRPGVPVTSIDFQSAVRHAPFLVAVTAE